MTDIFNTGVCYLMGVKVAEVSHFIEVRSGMASMDGGDHPHLRYCKESNSNPDDYRIELPDGYRWSLIGPAFSVTEEVARGLVIKANDELVDIGDCHWKDYTSNDWQQDLPTALESLYSAYEMMQMYRENPYGSEPVVAELIDGFDQKAIEHNEFEISLQAKWEQAQQRVSDNWYLLIGEKI
jgi:hypothetical protein